MGYLNYEFFDEFRALDNLCRDIYGESVDNKLGVTLYLEDMDKKAYRGSINVSGWVSDYNRLKSARNLRNELAHSRNSMTVNIKNRHKMRNQSKWSELYENLEIDIHQSKAFGNRFL